MNNLRTVYVQREGITPRAELDALSACLRFIIDCQAKKEAAPKSRPDDGTKEKEDSADGHRSTGAEPACFGS
jgi:hypothetical protein